MESERRDWFDYAHLVILTCSPICVVFWVGYSVENFANEHDVKAGLWAFAAGIMAWNLISLFKYIYIRLAIARHTIIILDKINEKGGAMIYLSKHNELADGYYVGDYAGIQKIRQVISERYCQ